MLDKARKQNFHILRSELVVVGLKGEIKDCPATTSLIPGKEGKPRVTNSSFLPRLGHKCIA